MSVSIGLSTPRRHRLAYAASNPPHHCKIELRGCLVPTKTILKLLSTVSLAAPFVMTGFSAFADDDVDVQTTAISPKVVLISLDGAKPDFIQQFIADGTLPANGGLAK